jgi:hypothetical protein
LFLACSIVSAAIVITGTRHDRRLHGPLPRLTVAVCLGAVFGAGVALIRELPRAAVNLGGIEIGLAIAFGIVIGLAIGLVALHDGPMIGRMRPPSVGEAFAGLAAGGVSGLGVWIVVGGPLGLIVGLVAGVGFTLTYAWTHPSPRPYQEVSAAASYAADRRASQIFGAIGGISTGLGFGISGYLSLGLHRGLTIGIASAILSGVAGAVTTSQAIALRITALGLITRGIVCWQPIKRLEGAYHRRILRQVGTVYQFRHDELSRYLSREPMRRHVE